MLKIIAATPGTGTLSCLETFTNLSIHPRGGSKKEKIEKRNVKIIGNKFSKSVENGTHTRGKGSQTWQKFGHAKNS